MNQRPPTGHGRRPHGVAKPGSDLNFGGNLLRSLSLPAVITLLHVIGVFLFASGFLLTRLQLEERNTCTNTGLSNHNISTPAILNGTVVDEKEKLYCNHPGRIGRAVVIIVDALRFDFAVYQPELEQQQRREGNGSVPYYLNKLPVLNRLLRTQPENTLLLRARADAPTTTLQRLKAITTGTLPTFVDAGSNFGGLVITEDNIIEQLVNHGRRVVFMGDDTWMGLFPNSFVESHPFPSFDVWDLHTVDDGVISQIFPALERNASAWDVLVAHFLGVDHAGHRYGPEHPAMADKLSQMDGVLGKIFDKVDDDTVVFVMGDHGMDGKGDHGGESELEVDTTLFVYSKKRLMQRNDASLRVLEMIYDALDKEFAADQYFVKQEGFRVIPQIDFVPTFSALLDIPIPFGNLGATVPELLFVDTKSPQGSSDLADSFANLLNGAQRNSHQIFNYLKRYSTARVGSDMNMEELETLFRDAESETDRFAQLSTDGVGVISQEQIAEQGIKAYVRHTKFARSALMTARAVWAQFDVVLILMGLIVLGLATLMYIIAGDYRSNASSHLYSVLMALATSVVGVLVGGQYILSEILEHSGYHRINTLHFASFIFAFSCGTVHLGLSLVTKSPQIYSRLRQFKSVLTMDWVLGLMLVVIHALTAASDSYTINEDGVTVYLLQTFGIWNLLAGLRIQHRDVREKVVVYSLGFVMITRISQLSTICRGEQLGFCTPTFNFSPTTSVAAPYTIGLSLLQVPAIILGMRWILRRFDSYQSTGSAIAGAIVPAGLCLSWMYWTLDTLEGHGFVSVTSTLGILKIWIARAGFLAVSVSSLYVWISDPLCMGLNVEDRPQTQQQQAPLQKIKILGMANGLGMSYLVFISIIHAVLTMFSKPMGGVMLGFAFAQLLLLIEIHALRYHHYQPEELMTQVAPPSRSGLLFCHAVALVILGHRYFFATGHQTVFSSIQWEVGFVGIEKVNWILSPLLVSLNTFGGHILFGMSVPLLVVWRRPALPPIDSVLRSSSQAVVFYLICASVLGLSTSLFAAHFRRHLMVWSVFTPRFIFQVLTMLGVDVLVGFVALGLIGLCAHRYFEVVVQVQRITRKSV
ncbi:mannose-ethanolamine phosphotransferase gpi13 [Quaeritorhiza haematococci]|nr:mannose-ethanolamine phosphotransferase gpi13 [Quaeritorhiza haematococci]